MTVPYRAHPALRACGHIGHAHKVGMRHTRWAYDTQGGLTTHKVGIRHTRWAYDTHGGHTTHKVGIQHKDAHTGEVG